MKIWITLSLFCIGSFAWSQTGQTFPELPGELLTGEKVILPQDRNDKLTIIGMAYSKKSEDVLRSWYEPMFNKFVLKRGIFDHMYDAHFFFSPMYTGAKKVTYNTSINKMKESNRKDLYPYLLFYKGEMDPYVDALNMKDKNSAYLYIIDTTGMVLYHTKGLYTEKKMEEIEGILDSHSN